MTPIFDPYDAPLVQLLRRLETEALDRIGPMFSVVEIADGDAAFREGEDGTALFIVIGGEAVVEKRIDEVGGRVAALSVLGVGDVFGELSMIDGRPRSATVRARGPLRLLRLGSDSFGELTRTDPTSALRVMETLMAAVSSRLHEANAGLVTLYETGRRLAMASDTLELCQVVLEEVVHAVPGVDAGVTALADVDSRLFAPVVSFGLPPDLPLPFPLDARGELFHELSARAEGLTIGPEHPLAGALGFFAYRWCLITGMQHDHELLGFVGLFANATACPFTPHHRVLMGIVANQASAAVERARRHR